MGRVGCESVLWGGGILYLCGVKMTLRDFERQLKVLYMPLGMYALRIVNDVNDAEDVVQDAFAKAWRKIEAGVDVGNFKAYMYMAVRNEAISLLRSRRETESIDGVPEPEAEVIDTSERDAALWRAIDSLPDRCREVFLMSKRDGMKNVEIAEELGISEKTVKNQLTKAFERLRGALEPSRKHFFLPFL